MLKTEIEHIILTLKKSSYYRGLGFNPLNYWFKGCDAHHINEVDVIFMPRKLHRTIKHSIRTGKNMKQVNQFAFWFLRDVVNEFIKMEDIAQDGIWEKAYF